MKAYRIKDGWIWVYEAENIGDDVVIVETRYKKLPTKENNKEITIDDFAERLIQKLQEGK